MKREQSPVTLEGSENPNSDDGRYNHVAGQRYQARINQQSNHR